MNFIKDLSIVVGVFVAGYIAVLLGYRLLGPNGASIAFILIGFGAFFFRGRHGLADKFPRHRAIAIGMILAGVTTLAVAYSV